MLFSAKFRRIFHSALAVAVLGTASLAFAGPPGSAPRGMRAMVDQHPHQGSVRQGPRPQNREHLEQWMNRHSNLSLDQQQRALTNEPGFRQLPAQTQQHLRNRLTQLNDMPPEQRRRLIERNEAIERLTPPQREQWRGAMQQLGALPVNRRRMVAQAFRDLRDLPPSQRESVFNSDRFRGQFSPQERGTLSQLLYIAPYLPAPHSSAPPPPPER